jgi:precorrin-3B C17-methyltransferase
MAEQGKTVAVVSSGDAGIYGMAGLIYEVLHEEEWTPEHGFSVEVVPGVTAAASVASLVGAPLAHDFAAISLSDLLTPLETIYKRVEMAAAADFVIVLYNPKSGRRTKQIEKTQRIIAQYRDPTTPVVIAKSVYREGEQVVLTDLAHLLDHEMGMLTTVIIGNSTTFRSRDKVITPRGYTRKYALGREE